jgi:SAM-dependent methyltransferase
MGYWPLRKWTQLFGAAAKPQPAPELAEYVLGFCSQSPEARAYAETHLGRLVRTLELLPKGGPADRILEMGAYMQITPALHTHCGYGEVRGCYLGPPGRTDHKTVVSSTGERFSCWIDLFNAESDPFPYPDGHFQAVVCCELFEHLCEDPMHMLAEVNRILAPGGCLLLSTPNICSLRSVAAVLKGYHPALFSLFTARIGGNKAEPRHAREYTPGEIQQLLEAGGFTVERIETGSYGLQRPEAWDWTIPLLQRHGMHTELRDEVTHALGRKSGPVRERYPSWLYA